MGTPLPPNQDGTPCIVCWGVDKPFGNIATPKMILMTFEGFSPGDEWEPEYDQLLLTPHLLQQTILPCTYSIYDGVFWWIVVFAEGTTFVTIKTSDPADYAFSAGPNLKCQTQLTNAIVEPDGNIAFGGTVTLDVTFGA